MRRRAAGIGLAAGLTLWVTGCQLVFDFQKVELAEAAPPGCDLPPPGETSVRLAHLVPDGSRIDLCVSRANGLFTTVHPLFDSSGTDCPAGITYKEVTARFGVPSGTRTFRIIDGDADCSASPIAEATLEVAAGTTVTLALVGDSVDEASLSALPETPATADATLVRFVHAVPDHRDDDLEAGLALNEQIPDNFTLAFEGVPFGATAPVGPSIFRPIDSAGYTDIGGNFGLDVRFFMRVSGTVEPLAVQLADLKANRSYTIYGVGDGDRHPHELWFCPDERTSASYLTSCGQPADLSIEAFATQLTDYFMTDVDARVSLVEEVVRDLDADLVCLSEVYVPEYLDTIEAAAEDRYSVVRSDDPSLSILGDLTTRDGEEPEPVAVPCSGASAEMAHQLLACTSQRCSDDGETFSRHGRGATACLADGDLCATETGAILLGVLGDADRQCWGCLVPALAAGNTFAATETLCTSAVDPELRWTFNRNAGVVVLAKKGTLAPIDGAPAELYRLPSFAWQKGALRVPLRVTGNGARIDFYCTHLTYQADATNPYVGPYGEGAVGPEGAAVEQRLQAVRLGEVVRTNATLSGRRAILAGELYSSDPTLHTSSAALRPFRPEVLDVLLDGMFPLVRSDLVGTCTWCDTNPLNWASSAGQADDPSVNGGGYWFAHLLGYGLGEGDVLATAVTHDERIGTGVDVPERIPASMSYGLRSTVRLTQ